LLAAEREPEVAVPSLPLALAAAERVALGPRALARSAVTVAQTSTRRWALTAPPGPTLDPADLR
jgi:hypothetical protein